MKKVADPCVSVILPTRNAARTLTLAIDSVLGQSIRNLELVISDDASIDDTQSIIDSYTDPRVRVVCSSIRLGAGKARDAAIEMARGKWLAFIDADDVWLPNRLESLLATAGNRDDVLVFDDILACHDAPAGLMPWRPIRGESAFGAVGRLPVDVPFADFISQRYLLMQPLVPASMVHALNLRHTDREFAEDTEFVLRLIEAGARLVYVPEAMYLYRITPGSLSSNPKRSEMMRDVLIQASERMQLDHAERAALRKKISLVERDIRYAPFLSAIKQRRWLAGTIMAARQPVLLWELLRRLGETLPYHLQRMRHHAKGR